MKKMLLIRHGQSIFNAFCHKYLDDEIYCQEARDQFHLDRTLMDCSLTNKGREEAYNIKIPFIRSEEIIVFVSPLKRALQTAQIVLKNHNLLKAKVLVIPHLSEVLSKICDLSQPTNNQDFEFSYDTIFMNKWVLEHSNRNESNWQDEFVDPHLRQYIQKSGAYGRRYLNILQQVFPSPLERADRCEQRSLQALNIMKSILSHENRNIAFVFSHNRILKYLENNVMHRHVEDFGNCEIRQIYP